MSLYLVPAPLDFGCDVSSDLREVLPDGTLKRVASLSYWICENAKTTRAYLKRVDALHHLCQPLQQMHIAELPRQVHKAGDHGQAASAEVKALLAPAQQGYDIGLVSEAGMPAVADPGSSVVRAAHDLGIAVVPLVGPSSLLLALAASGLNGQNFAFVGYLPQDATARTQRLRELEQLARKTGQTQMFIETPYRNTAVWSALLQTLQPQTRLSVSLGLTLEAQAQTHSKTVAQWRAQPMEFPRHLPAVFGLGY